MASNSIKYINIVFDKKFFHKIWTYTLLKKRFFFLFSFLSFIYLLLYTTIFSPNQTSKIELKSFKTRQFDESNRTFLNDIDSKRLNRLFKLLQSKERQKSKEHLRVENDLLKLISFENIAKIKNGLVNLSDSSYSFNNKMYAQFESEIAKYLKIDNKNYVQVTDSFVKILKEMSEQNSIKNPRTHITRKKIDIVRFYKCSLFF
jgi:hypothetical protein